MVGHGQQRSSQRGQDAGSVDAQSRVDTNMPLQGWVRGPRPTGVEDLRLAEPDVPPDPPSMPQAATGRMSHPDRTLW